MSDVVDDSNRRRVLNKIKSAEQQGLTELDLGHNQLTTLPIEICRLINLTGLDLGINRLTTLPIGICKLINLTYLYLDNNRFTTLPVEICRLTKLTELSLGGNRLTTLPVEICRLTKLTRLSLYGSRLTTLPVTICRLIRLTTLYLYDNPVYITLEQQGVNPKNTRQVLNYYRKIAGKHHNYLMVYSALALGCPWLVVNAMSVHWPTILPTN